MRSVSVLLRGRISMHVMRGICELTSQLLYEYTPVKDAVSYSVHHEGIVDMCCTSDKQLLIIQADLLKRDDPYGISHRTSSATEQVRRELELHCTMTSCRRHDSRPKLQTQSYAGRCPSLFAETKRSCRYHDHLAFLTRSPSFRQCIPSPCRLSYSGSGN